MQSSHITVTDQFCGAGGSSQGVRRFAQRANLGSGLEVRLALNHWKLAIDTHNTNFPEAIHECTDIQACDPRRYPSTTILVTSPECTNHSVAKGRKQVKSTTSWLDEPVGTLSAGGLHHALITGRAMGFLAPYYGEHGAARLDDAIPTLRTKDSHALVVGQPPRVEDLYFRMLKAHEVKAGMAFDRDYVVLGNQREQVKQLGNAVTPPVMELLIERCVESLN